MASSKKKDSILVVDDSEDTLEVLERNLISEGYKVFTASGVEEALRTLEKTHVDLVITDLKMPKVSGLDLMRHVKENFSDTETMMITGYGSIQSAVEAIKSGAEQYLTKPFTDDELLRAVRSSLETLRMHRTREAGFQTLTLPSHGLIGKSKALGKVFDAIRKAAPTSTTVLITGESGTGKELVARAIHYASLRVSAPFVPVNCGAVPEGLLESELFGHIRGAFSGAIETRAGFFQTAEGDIFLDEVSDTSASMQAKLLRVLQDKQICMVGSSRTQKVDVRIIGATNKDLTALVQKGHFREDLFFRINVITIALPPLRERGDDILLLAHHFAKKYADEVGKPIPAFSDTALQSLKNYYWPGNVRELENIVHRLVVMTDTKILQSSQLPPLMRFSALRETGLKRTLAEVEAEHIRNVLASVNGNKTRAAEILGIDRKTLRNKLESRKSDS